MSQTEFLEILARMERLGFISEDTDTDDLESIARALLDLETESEVTLLRLAVEALEEHIPVGTKEITIILCKLIASLA